MSIETIGEIKNGKKKTWIEKDEFGLILLVMTNGWQSTGVHVNDDVLKMIKGTIDEYFNTKE